MPKWSKGMVCKTIIRGFESRSHLQFSRPQQFVYQKTRPLCYSQGMKENASSRLLAWLPFASLLITIAAFSAGAPIKLAHRRAAPAVMAENDLRDEPAMYISWRGLDAMAVRSSLASK